MKLEILQETHKTYKSQIKIIKTVNLLKKGGSNLKENLRDFIPKRPDEDYSVYEYRLNNFAYTNLLSFIINEHTSRLHSSQIVFDDATAKHSYWEDFRANVDGAGTTENEFIDRIVTELFIHGSIYLYTTDIYANPITRIIPIETIINWKRDELGNLIYLKCVSDFDEYSIYTIFEKTEVAVYEVRDGNVKLLELTPFDFESFGFPVIDLVVNDSVSIVKNCVPKLIEHMTLDCKLFDLLSFAYVQRTVKPVTHLMSPYHLPSDNDSENPFSLPENFKTGNPYVLVADQFKFEEMTGKMVPHLQSEIDQIRESILMTCNINGANSTNTHESGESKKVDFWKQEIFLKKLGNIIIRIYSRVLDRISMQLGLSSSPQLNGLDSFSLRREDDFIKLFSEQAVLDLLPKEVVDELVKQYSTLLLPNFFRGN